MPLLRLLHLCGTARGAPWLVEMLRELQARGHDVTAVISSGEGGLADALDAAGVRHLVLDHDVLLGARPLRAVRRISALVQLLRREQPDVLQSHLFPSNVAGRFAGWLADVPIRLSMNAGPYFLESPIFDRVEVLTSRLDTRVIASCEYTRRLYIEKGVPADRVALIYYGSRADRFDPTKADAQRLRRDLGLPADVPLIGMVAYFYPPPMRGPEVSPRLAGRGIKGHDILLHALPRLLARLPRAHVAFVGDGWGPLGVAYQHEMEALAASLGVSHAVTFMGHRTDVTDILAGVDVAVQCSRSENLGGAIEALLMGAPLVVTRVGGLVDAVHDGETGLVVPPDDPAALADAIIRLASNRPFARRLGAAGRALMLDRFTMARTADDVDVLCRTLAQDAGMASTGRLRGYRLIRTIERACRVPILAARVGIALAPMLTVRWRQRLVSKLRGAA
jgi:glycosyltransferase involved in cell wall biosynthesis